MGFEDFRPDPCYWKIYLNRDNLLTIVEMQSFDEYDYDQNKFYRHSNGEIVKFDSEEEAVLFLNKTFKSKHIDPEYLSPNNKDFFRDLKHE